MSLIELANINVSAGVTESTDICSSARALVLKKVYCCHNCSLLLRPAAFYCVLPNTDLVVHNVPELNFVL